MKKIVLVILVALLVVISSCANTKVADKTNEPSNGDAVKPNNETIPPENVVLPKPVAPSARPIVFDSMLDAVSFVVNPKLDKYNPNHQQSYQKMVDAFQKDGYITTISHTSATKYDDTVTLYPEATYEDIGVHGYFWFGEDLYQVLVYTVKEGEQYYLDLQTETVLDYYKTRWKLEYDEEDSLEVDHAVMQKLFFKERADGKIGAHTMIDDNHYVVIYANTDEVTKEKIADFAQGIVLGKAELS